jgi:hypothetical protein
MTSSVAQITILCTNCRLLAVSTVSQNVQLCSDKYCWERILLESIKTKLLAFIKLISPSFFLEAALVNMGANH